MIGCVCKCREAFSLAVLIGRGLDHKSLIGTFTTAKISGSNTWALYGAAEETI